MDNLSKAGNVIFLYEGDNTVKRPFGSQVRGITKNGKRPVGYTIQFNPSVIRAHEFDRLNAWIRTQVEPAIAWK